MKSRIFSMLFLLFNVFYRRRSCQAEFLACQIRMLRKRLKEDFIIPSVEERKELLALGAKFGHDIDEFLEVVIPETYRRWLRKEAAKAEPANVGRKPTEGEAAELVLKMKRENPIWGYTRILGELLKLGIKLARTTVKRVLQRNGETNPTPTKEPRPKPAIPMGSISRHARRNHVGLRLLPQDGLDLARATGRRGGSSSTSVHAAFSIPPPPSIPTAPGWNNRSGTSP